MQFGLCSMGAVFFFYIAAIVLFGACECVSDLRIVSNNEMPLRQQFCFQVSNVMCVDKFHLPVL